MITAWQPSILDGQINLMNTGMKNTKLPKLGQHLVNILLRLFRVCAVDLKLVSIKNSRVFFLGLCKRVLEQEGYINIDQSLLEKNKITKPVLNKYYRLYIKNEKKASNLYTKLFENKQWSLR